MLLHIYTHTRKENVEFRTTFLVTLVVAKWIDNIETIQIKFSSNLSSEAVGMRQAEQEYSVHECGQIHLSSHLIRAHHNFHLLCVQYS